MEDSQVPEEEFFEVEGEMSRERDVPTRQNMAISAPEMQFFRQKTRKGSAPEPLATTTKIYAIRKGFRPGLYGHSVSGK
jgi:hypothetical protein